MTNNSDDRKPHRKQPPDDAPRSYRRVEYKSFPTQWFIGPDPDHGPPVPSARKRVAPIQIARFEC